MWFALGFSPQNSRLYSGRVDDHRGDYWDPSSHRCRRVGAAGERFTLGRGSGDARRHEESDRHRRLEYESRWHGGRDELHDIWQWKVEE